MTVLDCKIRRAAACMAGSNMGLLSPEYIFDSFQHWYPLRDSRLYSLRDAVDEVLGRFAETERDFNYFVKEARSWENTIQAKGLTYLVTTFPYHKPWLDVLMNKEYPE